MRARSPGALGEEPPPRGNGKAILDYLQTKAPPVYDPFCGGGSIPLEAQRLGLRAYGSDLNPVAVLISKALVEIPPKFAGRPPVNPKAQAELKRGRWNGKGAQGLAEDVRYYGQWMRDEAEKRIGHLYPKATLTDGSEATVIAWLWARTVRSPDPAAKGAMVPLVSSFMLSTKEGKKAWAEPVIDPNARDGWRFEVRIGALSKADERVAAEGTKSGRANFRCLLTGASIGGAYADQEAQAGRMSATHTMLAMYHLANSADLERLEGVLEIAKAAGVTSWRKANVAVFTGSSKGPDVSLNLDKGPKVHTLWGYLAWKLLGQKGLDIVQDAEAARTNPGSELFISLLTRAAPCVILLDELVLYVRPASGRSFRGAPVVYPVADRGRQARAGRFGRGLAAREPVGSRRPEGRTGAAAAGTGFRSRAVELATRCRRRDIRNHPPSHVSDARHRRRAGARRNSQGVPRSLPQERRRVSPEAKEAGTSNCCGSPIPIHPELFDRLSKDWASLQKFQRTRGVLKFMANVVGVLWQQQTKTR